MAFELPSLKGKSNSDRSPIQGVRFFTNLCLLGRFSLFTPSKSSPVNVSKIWDFVFVFTLRRDVFLIYIFRISGNFPSLCVLGFRVIFRYSVFQDYG